MTKAVFCLIACLFFAQSGYAGSITISTQVPASGTPAGVHNPGCAGGVTSGEEIIELLRTGAEAFGYGQIADTVASNNWARNRLQVMLGVHNGPSICRVFCGSVPSAPTGYEMCVDGSCRSVSWNSSSFASVDFDAWAYMQEWADNWVDDNRVVCFLAKNWKHDQSRTFSARINY